MKQNANSSFWYIIKITNLKTRLWNHHPIKGKLARASQLLTRTPWFVSIIWLKSSANYFFFVKVRKYPLKIAKEENSPSIIWSLRFCALQWGCEIRVTTVNPTAKLWDLAGLYSYLFNSPFILLSCWHHFMITRL